MKLLLQRVSQASVSIDNAQIAAIGSGLLVFLGITHDDTHKNADYLIQKLVSCRLFNDDQNVMNLDVQQVKGSILVVSQFTLYGDCRKGRRPSFSMAAKPADAKPLYEYFITQLSAVYPYVKSGIFGADMQVKLVNDGPVTIELLNF